MCSKRDVNDISQRGTRKKMISHLQVELQVTLFAAF